MSKQSEENKDYERFVYFELVTTSEKKLLELWKSLEQHTELEKIVFKSNKLKRINDYYFRLNPRVIKKDPLLIEELIAEEVFRQNQANLMKEQFDNIEDNKKKPRSL